MSYVNLPVNLQDMFYTLSDRVTKLETGPSGPQDTADYASTTAQAAYVQAINAGVQATAASLQAGVALQSADGKNTVHYQTSGPTGGGITGDVWFQVNGSGVVQYQYIYNGSSWVNSPITDTVIASLDAGKITTGTLTSIAIYAGSSGQFQVSSAGALVATAATIQGTITSSSGTIGGWTINSGSLTANSGLTSLNSSSGSITTIGSITGSSLGSTGGISAGGTISTTSGGLTIASGGATITGTVAVTGTVTMSGNLVVQSMSSLSATGVVWSSSNSRFYLTTSTERHKDNITPIPEADYLSKILSLQPVTFNYKPEFTDNPNQIISGLIAERVAEIPEFSTVINLDKDGLPESISYDRLSVFIFPALKQINNRLEKLEGK